MPRDDSLKAFYEARAILAYDIEHVPGRRTQHSLERYRQTQEDELPSLEAAFAKTWHLPAADTAHTLPWCSICGRDDRALLPGQTLCAVCQGNIAAGEITPGEHATAPQGQEKAV